MARRLGAAALVVVALVLVVRWVSAPREGLPLDPHGTGPLGLGALVDTLEVLGGDVIVADSPPADVDVVLLLRDQLDDAQRAELRRWVRDGGRLVVTDPDSPLTPPRSRPVVAAGTPTLPRGCDVAALAVVDRVEPPSAVGYDVDDLDAGATACFADGERAWLVATADGDGVTVALGGEHAWLNRNLDGRGHPELAMALLAPQPDTRVGLVELQSPAAGDAELTDLIDDSVWWALAQLAVALGLLVAWRFPRDAPVMDERPTVALPGSELVLATADLRVQRQARGAAAASLRRAARDHALARLAAPVDTADEVLATLAHQRTGVPVDVARRALDAAPTHDRGLVAQGVAVAALRRAFDRPQPPTVDPSRADREQERS